MAENTISGSATIQPLRISLGERSYPILIGSGLLAQASSFDGLPRASQALIVSNETVAPLYAESLREQLGVHHQQVHVLALPDGEAYKDWQTLNRIFDVLLENRDFS
ncbi:MAG: 3-dehydroquinate synthase, partial [SAR324 cluster bacterium]|nr:3-dehydroquinate synthase [SAR324 cluster bacterium]